MDLLLSISPDLFLRVLRPAQAEILFHLVQANRAHLRQWLPWVDATQSVLDSRRYLEVAYGGYLQGRGITLGIFLRQQLVGVVGFHAFDEANRVTSIGYWLSGDQCGQGIMRKSVARCLDYAFLKRKMNRLYLRCAVGNIRSRKIALALGFTHEGTQRQAEWLYDHFVDLEMYSLLASEWPGSSAFAD